MKLKYIIAGLACSLLLTNTSCDLDRDPLGQYSDVTEGDGSNGDNSFKDKKAVLLYRQTIYDQLKEGQEHWYVDLLLTSETHSDNAYAGTTGAEAMPFEDNALNGESSIMARDWKQYLADIGIVNKMILNIDGVEDPTLTTDERAQYKAEAKIFRALVYFDMVRIWGNVPLITTQAPDITSENITEVYPEYFPGQSTEQETYLQIEKDLLEALPDAPNNDGANKTLFTKTVARALLAKVYAEKTLRDYDKVIQYADEVEADGIDLIDNYGDLFAMNAEVTDLKVRNTKESILEAQFFTGATNWATWMFGRDLTNWGTQFSWAKWITPSRDLIRAFQKEGDEIRFKESIVYYECSWSNYYSKDNYPFMYKFRSGVSSIIKIRYADILLLKAEALIMKDSPDLNAAADIIDRVRKRADLSKLEASSKASKETMLDALLKERRLELAFEGQRWFDLVRLNKVEEVMNAVFAKDSGRNPQVNKFGAHSYLLPIADEILDQNVNLKQNPKY